MKTYKQFELGINILLISFFVIYLSITHNFELLFTAYFVVGGIQLLSMLIHLGMGWFTGKGSLRRNYYWLLLVVFASCFAIIGIWFLLFFSPLMAVFYTYICYREYETLKLKELVHLK